MKRDFNIFDEKMVAAYSKVLTQQTVAGMKVNGQAIQDGDEEIIEASEARLQKLGKRNARILKRIKEKGYYAQHMFELKQIITSKIKKERDKEQRKSIFTALANFIILGTNDFQVFKGISFDITDYEWEFAIDFGFYLANPDVYFSDDASEFLISLDEYIPHIWFCLIFIHAMSELEGRDEVNNRILEFAALHTWNDELKKKIDNLTLQLRDERSKAEKEMIAAVEQVQKPL